MVEIGSEANVTCQFLGHSIVVQFWCIVDLELLIRPRIKFRTGT